MGKPFRGADVCTPVGPTTHIRTTVTKAQYRQLRLLAIERDATLTTLVTEALVEALAARRAFATATPPAAASPT